VIEYNVRFGDPETQPLMLRLQGDLAETMLALAQARLSSDMISWKSGASVCVVACSAGYPGDYATGKTITGIEDAESNGAKVFHSGTAEQNGKLATAGGRVLGISAAGPDLGAAASAAYQAASKIHFEGMHYRRDIGRKGLQRARPL
jgi:phosphoribosylamine--glycine ligase